MDIDPDNPLAVEIQQEMATTYFAACKRMVDSLEVLEAFDRDSSTSQLDSQQIARRADLLEDAAERVHFVVVQREAINLKGYEDFFKDYKVPDEVRMRMGAKRPN
jgi:hypothetical protein